MKPYLVAVITLLLVSFPNMGKAQGNLVFNGSFDTSTAGWMTTNVFGSGYESSRGNPPGDLLLDGLSSPSTASQTITSLTPATIYVVSGDYRRGGDFTDYTFGMALDGIFLFETADPGNFNWQRFSFTYAATSSSALLSLSSKVNGSDFAYAIDNIAMQVVPEPSSLWLFAIGGIVSAICLRIAGNNCCSRTS